MAMSRRGFLRTTGAGAAAVAAAGWERAALAQKKQVVTIAFPETITSFDPHPVPRNTPRESMYESVFDRFLQQDRQLKYQPQIVESWRWGPDKMTMDMKIRQGVKFHDGSDLTAEDVAFSMERLKEVSIYKATYSKVKEYQVRDKATMHLVFERFDPSFPRWIGFLASFVIPKAYFTKLGPDDKARGEEFSRKPIGSGPYRVVSFTPGSTLVLEAFDRYWKGAPPIKRAVFKMVTDPTARVAEIQSMSADITSEVPVEEFGRLAGQPGLKGLRNPIADMAQIFLNPRFAPFQKEEVRLAVHHAIDKKTLVEKVLLGFGIPSSSTEGPLYDAYDPGIAFAYDPARARQLLQQAGYTPASPLRLKVMTTRGVRAKDFEVMTAITQMWKDVGIEGELEVVTIPQWFSFRTRPRAGRPGPGAAVALLLVEPDRRPDQLGRLPEQRQGAVPRLGVGGDARADRPGVRREGRRQADRRRQEGGAPRDRAGLRHPALPGRPAGDHEEGAELPALPDRRPRPPGDVLDLSLGTIPFRSLSPVQGERAGVRGASSLAMKPIRVLMAKVGLDGHDRGIKVVARYLRDAGMEVIYTGLHRTPEQVVAMAVQEDADVLGISILSGAHMTVIPRVLELLRGAGAGDILVVAGGVMPDEDVPALKAMGVADVLLQETPPEAITARIRELVEEQTRR